VAFSFFAFLQTRLILRAFRKAAAFHVWVIFGSGPGGPRGVRTLGSRFRFCVNDLCAPHSIFFFTPIEHSLRFVNLHFCWLFGSLSFTAQIDGKHSTRLSLSSLATRKSISIAMICAISWRGYLNPRKGAVFQRTIFESTTCGDSRKVPEGGRPPLLSQCD